MSVLGKILGWTRRDRVRNADIMNDLALDMDIVPGSLKKYPPEICCREVRHKILRTDYTFNYP